MMHVGVEQLELRHRHTEARIEAELESSQEDDQTPKSEDLSLDSLGYERITRAIRQNIALDQALGQPKRPANRTAARLKVVRTIEDRFQREAEGPNAEMLHLELLERLDTPSSRAT